MNGGGEKTKLLYENLKGRELYTKSYDEFVKDYSTPGAKTWLHSSLTEMGLVDVPAGEWMSAWFDDTPSGQSSAQSVGDIPKTVTAPWEKPKVADIWALPAKEQAQAIGEQNAYEALMKRRNGDLVTPAHELAESGLDARQKAELEKTRTPLEAGLGEDKKGQATVARYRFEVEAMADDMKQIEGAVGYIDRQLTAQLGSTFMKDYEARIKEAEGLLGQLKAKQTPELVKRYNEVVTKIEEVQNHPLVIERNKLGDLYQTQHEKAKNLLREERFQTVADYLDVQESVQAYSDKESRRIETMPVTPSNAIAVLIEKAKIYAPEMAKRAAGKLLASIGAVDEVVENLTFGDDTYNWRDAAQDYMRGFEKDAQVIAAAPSKFSRPLISNTAKWKTGDEVLDVDFDSSGNIQSVRDAAGYTVQAMLSEDQKREIAALPRQKQTNWGTVPYKSAEIGMDLGVLMLMTKGIGGGFRVAGMGAKTSQKIATPMAVAGQMMNPLYEQGLEMFDGDKEKASQFAAIAAPGIGIVSTLIGSESIIAGGGRSLLARITGMGVKSHLKKAYVGLTPGQAATKYLGNVFKEGTGEFVEETILEELITSGTAVFLGADFEMPEMDEAKETALLSFITGTSFASVSELGNKDMKYASLLAGMDMGDKFITHLDEAVQSGLVPVEKGQESQFVAEQRARLTELKSELDAIAPKAPRETRIQVLELLDARRDEKNRLAKLKTAGTPASVQLSEQRIAAINNKIDNLLGSPTSQQQQPTGQATTQQQQPTGQTTSQQQQPTGQATTQQQQPTVVGEQATTTTETPLQTEVNTGQTGQTTPQNTQNTGVSQGLTTQTVVEENQAPVETPVIRKQKEQLNPNTTLQQAVGKRAVRYNKVGRVVEEDGTYYLQTDKGEMHEIGKEGTLYDNDVTAYEDRQVSYVSDNEIYIGESSQDGPHEYAGVNRNEEGEIQSINLVRPDGQTITVRDKKIAQELYDKHTNERGVFEIAEEFEDEADSLISEEMTPEELAAADDLFESMPQAAERFIQNPDDEFTPQELEDIRAWADSNEETKLLADEVTRKQEGQNVLQNSLNVEGQAGTTDGADQSIAAQGQAIEDERGTRRFAVRLAAAFNRFFGATVKVVTDKRAVQARMSQPDAMASKRLMFIGPVGISNAAEVEALSFLEMAREMERDLPEEILLGDDSGEDVSGNYQSVKREDFIYHNTGWFKFPDGKWRREMPPGWMQVDASKVRTGEYIPLTDVISGPILEMYPALKDFDFVYIKGPLRGNVQLARKSMIRPEREVLVGGTKEYGPEVSLEGNRLVTIQTPASQGSEVFDGVVRHEVQHIIQSVEGFGQGGSPHPSLVVHDIEWKRKYADYRNKKDVADAKINDVKNAFLSLPTDVMETLRGALASIHWIYEDIPSDSKSLYDALRSHVSGKDSDGNMIMGRLSNLSEILPKTKAGKQAEAIAMSIFFSDLDASKLQEPQVSDLQIFNLYQKIHGEAEARMAENPTEGNPMERFNQESGGEPIVLGVIKGTYDKPLPRHLKTADGEIFGMYDPETNTIFIDPEKVGPETALHEMAEAWLAMIENRYPEMFERGLEQIKGTIYDEYVRETYPHLKEERDILREALAQAIGDEGAMLLKKQNEGLMAWLKEMWNAITQWAGVFKSPDAIANMTIDEFIKLGAGSIVFADQLSGIVEDAFVDDFIAAESTYVSAQQIRDTLDPVGQRAFDIAIEPYNSWARMDFSKLPADVAIAMRNAAASGLHPSDFKQPAPAAPMAPAENTDTGSTVRRIDAKLQQRGLSAEGATVGILGRYNLVKAAIARMTDPGALDQFLPFLRDLEKQIQSLKKNLKIGKSDVKAAVGALLKKEVGELRLLVRNGATNPQITEALADEYSRGFTRLDASNGVALQGGVDENGPFLDVVDIDKGKKMRIDGADLTALVREQLGIQTPSQAAAPTVEMLAGALEPETLEDHIALFFAAGGRISDKSFFEWSDRRYVKDNSALYYQFLRKPEKGGIAIDSMLDGLPRSFENAGDANARPEQAIVDFILGQNLKKYLEHRVRQQGGKRLSDAFYQATDTGIIDEFRRSATAEDSAEADMFAVFPTWPEVFDFIARIGAVERGILSPEIFEVLNEVSRTGVSPQEFSGKSMSPDEIEAYTQEVIDFVYGTQDTVEPIVQPTVQPAQPTAPPLDVSGLSDEEVSELLEMIDHNTKDGVIDWDGVEGMAEFFALTGPLSQNITDAIARKQGKAGQATNPVLPAEESIEEPIKEPADGAAGTNDEFIPTRSPKQIELDARIDQAETELAQAQAALKEKRRELDKTMMADQEDLFGERKSQEPGMIFDERVDADARSTALGPYERRVKSAQDEVKRLRALLPDMGGPEPTIFDSIPPPTEFGVFGKGFFGMKISKVTNEKITRWINSALRHTFTPQGFLNRTTWSRNLKRIGWIAGEMRKAELLSGRLKTAIREVYYTPKMIAGRVVSRTKPANMDAILKNLDEMLRDPLMHDSDPIIRQAFYKYKNLDPRIGEILYQMRKHVDAMSAELVALGVVDGDLAISILENMETYLTRSYQVHDDPNWITKVKDGPAWNKARVWLKGIYADKIAVNRDLRQEYLDFYNKAAAIYLKSNGPATQAKAMKAMQHWRVKITQADVEYTRLNDRFQNKKGALDAELEAMLREQKEKLSVSGVGAKGSLGSKDLGILKQRNDIPPALLELYGEYLRPDVNYMRSIFKQIHLLENAKFLRDIETIGVAEGWLTIDPEGPHNELIAAESSSVMAPLNGYYTTPELAQAFKEYNEASNRMWGTGMTFWIGLMSAAKYSKTILSWTTQLVNFFSNTAFMWMNGHYVNPVVDIPLALAGRAGKSFQEAWDLAWTEIGVIGKDGRNDEKIKELYEAGVLAESVTWGEINELLTELRANSERVFENEGWDNAMTKIESFLTGAQKLYQFGDNFWKILMYSMERQRVAKLQFGKKYDTLNPDEKQAVDDEAADRTKNLLPTYSLIPKNIRALRMFPGTGTFVSFPYEATRTFFNAWKYGIRDATTKTPYKEMGVDYAKMVALRKIMGMSLMTAGMYGLAAVARNYWDFDDEEAMNDSLPPWAKNSIIIPLFRDGSEFVYVDAGRNIPHGYILKAINPIIYDRPNKWKAVRDEILEPFLGVDMTLGAFLEALYNTKELGKFREIASPDEPNQLFFEDRGGVPTLVATGDYKRLQHALGPFVPGAATSMNRLQKSIFDPELNYSGKLDPWVEGLSLTTGLRVSPADAQSSTIFIADDLGDRKFSALRILSSEAKKQKYEGKSDEERERLLARYRENSGIAYQRVMSEAIKKYSNAIKMKADEATVIENFSNAGFNAAEIRAIIDGEIPEPKYGFEKVEKKSGKKRAPSKKK